MHNNIMTAGSRDRPPMLATGRYAQWQSRFMRYVDTKPNGEALRICILQGPYKLSNIIIPGQPATDESPAVPERTIPETFLNITPENKAHYDAEKKTIHLLLTGIGDEIYSTVDACKTAHDMWIAIERLQQGESLNKQDVKTSLFWEFGRFTSRDEESIESYYSSQNANPLALVAVAQQYPDPYYQAPKSHKSYAPPSKQSSFTRSHATTRNKGKEIAKSITPLSESASEVDNSGSDAEPLKKVQYDVEHNVFANERQHSEQPKPINNTYVVEKVDSNVIPDSSDMCDNDSQADQNAEECDDERVVLATLIANLQLDTEENKKIQKQLKKTNTSLAH
ncbi:hypothetical protein Tco_0752353 [Tanacetum coccineum]|uniref:Uncharacterized protein n=1 Tax=Tanacetum coccineum TaxID=301880 RepID=A0ABQ4Z9Y1_9ASTR